MTLPCLTERLGSRFGGVLLGAIIVAGARRESLAQDYTLSIEAPAEVVLGEGGVPVTFQAECRLQMDPGAAGVQGWTISVATEGPIAIIAVTTDGTAGAEIDADPPGLRDGGFEVTDLATSDDVEGAVSGVVLSLAPPITIGPDGSPYTVLSLTLEARGEGASRIYFHDGLAGPGAAVRNTVTESGFDVVPAVVGADVSIGAPVLEPDIEAPAGLDFGVLAVGSEESRTLTISNHGEGALRIENIVLPGESFRLAALSTPLELAPGEETGVVVVYAPSASRADASSLLITSNDPDEPTVTVVLSGIGGSASAGIEVDPPLLSFGRVAIGDRKNLEVIVSNRGSETVDLSGMEIDTAGGFRLEEEPASTSIPPLGALVIAVSFAPSRPGPHRGALTFESIGGTVIVPLTGSGVAESAFRRGDTNADGRVDMSDPVSILRHLFLGSPGPSCPDAADADDSGVLQITDPLLILRFLFNGGPPPRSPFLSCGSDVAEDGLSPCAFPEAACPGER